MQPPYIPTTDSAYADWLDNFSTKLTAAPTDYGLVAGDAVAVAAVATTFANAYALVLDPDTRTSPNIAGKDDARTAATAVVRPYAIAISLNMGVDSALKLGIGVNLPNRDRTPIPPPLTAPTLTHVGSITGQATIGYADSSTPTSKKKPFGAIGMEVRQSLADVPPVDPAAFDYVGQVTKSPFPMTFGGGDQGKTVTVRARWVTRSGPTGIAQRGPWSDALAFGVL